MKYQDLQNKIIKYVPHDKCLHFIVGFFLGLLTLHFFLPLVAISIVTLGAIAKEIRDEIKYKGFDLVDIIYTVIPVLAMAASI